MPVTAPPIIIDLVHPARDGVNGGHYIGPLVVGNALYAVLISQPPSLTFLNVYKSTDSGATWTNLDTAHRPTLNDNDAVVIQAGTLLQIGYSVTAAGPIRLISFNTATDTFGAISADGPSGDLNQMVQFGNGDFCVSYVDFATGLVAVAILSGGVWGSVTTIPGINNNPNLLVLGADNIARVFYFDQLAPGINVHFRTFSAGGVLGPEQAVFSSTFFPNPFEAVGPLGRTVIWNGNFELPYYDANGHAGIYTGAPYTAPVWSFALVNTLAFAGTEKDRDGFTTVDASNNLIHFWTAQDGTSVPNVDRVYYAINSGAGFGAPQLFYDQIANQPTQPHRPGALLHTLSAARFASGRFGAIVALDITVPSACAGFFLSDVAGLGCPKNAQGV